MSFITGIPIQNETVQKYTTPNECHEQISPLYGRGGVRGGLLWCYGHWQHIFLSIGHDIFFILCILISFRSKLHSEEHFFKKIGKVAPLSGTFSLTRR